MHWFVACQSNAGSCECDDAYEMAAAFKHRFRTTPYAPCEEDEYEMTVAFDDPFTAGEFCEAVMQYNQNTGNDLWMVVGADPDSHDEGYGPRYIWNESGFCSLLPPAGCKPVATAPDVWI